ncbi:cytochrome b/b6 domain-containing protein [Aquabacterium sp.]|uniref:cytochrome b/b6 domain-containing protein n=1 Tax=Aquabacterium sp. TaxID=1872578 RepID=UPI002E33E4DE|nr:cytochrome b/b6 domain-containing protein [Aquabacterium sp.]HEX5312837.1 cytochrome b/b6 domain-containing protein [Aquabacterium sp.]
MTQTVWSPLVRLTHWGVAALVLFNLFNETGRIHRWGGYAAAALVVCRLLYGLLRPDHDPASIRIPGPAALKEHLKAMGQKTLTPSHGHNPVGMWAALIMWALILALGITGWMSQLDRYWGEEWLEELHEGFADVLMGVVVVHWLGVISMSLLLKQNLVRAMLTGGEQAKEPRHR